MQTVALTQFTTPHGHAVTFRYPHAMDAQNMLTFINELILEDTFIRSHKDLKNFDEEQKFLDQILLEMELKKRFHLAVEIDGQYAGNGEIRRGEGRSDHVGEVGVSILSKYREKGIGTRLLQTLIAEGKNMGLRLLTLDCFENNHRALHVYRKVGFRRCGMTPHAIHYKGEDIGEVKMYFDLMA